MANLIVTRLRNILFYACIALVAIGIYFRFENWIGAATFIALGFLGIFLFFTGRLIKNGHKKRLTKQTIFIHLLILVMCATLFGKYLNYSFASIRPSLLFPLFGIASLIVLLQTKAKDIKLISVCCLFVLSIFPLFFGDVHRVRGKYSIEESYGRYDPSRYVAITLPYKFKHKNTERLCNSALKLNKIYQFDEAVTRLWQARNIEPDNPEILFHLSNYYARWDSLEKAILLLDTAIAIDHLKWAGLFNNRGLLYYKLNENKMALQDYNKAIELDPKNPVFYANVALVYYYLKDFDNACQSVTKAEQLGEDISGIDLLLSIKQKYCK